MPGHSHIAGISVRTFYLLSVALAIIIVMGVPGVRSCLLLGLLVLAGSGFLALLSLLIWLHPGRLLFFGLVSAVAGCGHGVAWLCHKMSHGK
jgi:hypothetical protein